MMITFVRMHFVLLLPPLFIFVYGYVYVSQYPSPSEHERVRILTQNISDDFERHVMANQMLYCPLYPMCPHLQWVKDYSDSVMNSTFYGSCCGKIESGDICFKNTTSVSCILPQYKRISRVTASQAYLMKTSCSENFKEEKVIRRCNEQTDMTDLSLFIPVYSISSENVYRNRHCAKCNFERTEEIENWIAQVLCRKAVPFSSPPESEREMLQIIQQNFNCNILFHSSSSNNLSNCEWVKFSKCNQTGRWRQYDEMIERGCHSYTSIYNYNYNNVFCYMCNENRDPRVRCDETHIVTGSLDIGSFSGLLRYRTEPEKIEQSQCPTSAIYIANENICKKVYCPPLSKYIPSSQTCDPVFEKVSNVKYVVYYNLTLYHNNKTCSLNNVTKDWYHFLTYVIKSIIVKDLKTEYSGVFTHLQTFTSLPSDVLYEQSFVLHLEFTELGLHDQKNYIKQLTSSTVSEITFNGQNISIELQVLSPNLITNENKFKVATFRISSNSLEPASTVFVIKNYFCPRIKIEKNQTGLSDSALLLIRNKSDRETGINEDIMICLQQHIEAIPIATAEQPSSTSNRVEQILSLVGSTISILSLICLLLVYSVCKELRTIPGINNMILACHLIVANILYLFGFNSTSNLDLCVAIGVSVHYFWLASIMWMHICSVHMFRVFVFMMKNPNANYSKRVLIFYAVYANIVALVGVSSNVIYYVASQQRNGGYLGYGGDTCYISSPDMVLFTFAIPVGFILVSNVILFCVVIFQIQRLPDVSSTHGKNRKNTFVIYTKLSCLTGITWIFGYIHQWTLIQEFSYVFIILNASQGLFMFLSFGCTARVRQMCCSKLSSAHTKPSTSTSKTSTPLTVRSSQQH